MKASTDRLGGLLAYYAGLAEDRTRPAGPARGPVDYYLDPEEPPGRWWGRGLGAVGLSGEVSGDDLRSLLEGRHPRHGRVLGRRFGDSSARGFDATFSAPKSVSALWALTPDLFVRAEVLAAHGAAVKAALGWFEAHGAVTRRGRDGVDQVDTQGIVAALFRQHTSRTVDPQLHTHAVIAAKVQDPTGRWLSLDARFLKRQQRTIGWVYDVALRGELTRRLGVTWEQTTEGPVDMTCVPLPVRDVLSQRSAQVKAKLNELIRRWSVEHDGADPRMIAALERTASVSSRPGKVHGVDGATLHDTWVDQARAVGFEPDTLTQAQLPGSFTEPQRSDMELLAEALRRVAEESSTWLRADIARHLATLLPTGQGATAADVVARIDDLAAQAEAQCVGLAPERPQAMPCRRDGRPVAEHVTDQRLTTETILGQEVALQRWAQSHRYPTPSPIGDSQAVAAEAIAGAASLVVVVGPAGTGKTTTAARAVRALEAQGRPVIGLAPSGKAADVMAAEAGCATDTLAGFLTRSRTGGPSQWRPGTTIILDEAGMAGTEDLARLVALVRRHQWRLVAVGDPAQLPAVGRGGVFAHWCATVHHHELVTPRRFDRAWEAAASLALRAGDPRAADTYAGHGRLLTSHPALVAGNVAEVHQGHTRAGRTVAITTNTTETARAINLEIQRALDPVGSRPRRRLGDGTHASVGDQIATRRNDPALRTDQAERIRNRHTWTVTAIEPNGAVTATHPGRGTVTLPGRYVDRHVELGWAVTGYGNQGDTVDIGLAVLEPGTARNHAYVALTRGRANNTAWIPDPTGTLDPADQLAAMITRTPDHASALATRAQLNREAGLIEPQLPPAPERGGSNRPRPFEPATDPPFDPALDERISAVQARLNRLQHRHDGRSLSR
ncbi:MAG: MobF family relaxase [Acidimicrobiales bacterium]